MTAGAGTRTAGRVTLAVTRPDGEPALARLDAELDLTGRRLQVRVPAGEAVAAGLQQGAPVAFLVESGDPDRPRSGRGRVRGSEPASPAGDREPQLRVDIGYEELSPTSEDRGTRTRDVFADLPPDVADLLTDELRTVRVGPGETIIEQATAGDALYAIVDGEVEVVVRGADEEERVVASLGGGEFFGERALLEDAPRNATVRAVTGVRLLRMPREALFAVLDRTAGVGDRLSEVAQRRSPGA